MDVGGLLWDETLYGEEVGDWPNGCPKVSNPGPNTTFECGSNSGNEQSFVAPARRIVSSVPSGTPYFPNVCGDDLFSTSSDGYGYCTGTSMSAPHVSGVLGLARSIYPTLPKIQLVPLMQNTASGGGVHNSVTGYGLPNAGLLAERLLGTSGGVQLRNRLTPMFVLRNLVDKDRLYTTNPTLAAAAVYGEYMVTPFCQELSTGVPECHFDFPEAFARPYSLDGISIDEAAPVPSVTYGPLDGYAFPSLPRWPVIPSASFYVFTTPQNPFSSTNLIPLKKLLFASSCDWRDHVYATNTFTVNYYTTTDFCSGEGTYLLDGIEGYVMAACPSTVNGVPTNGCTNYADRSLPQPLYLRYSNLDESYALLLGSQLSLPEFQGYQQLAGGMQNLLGYVFPNEDSDGDLLIDGQERLLGTSHLHGDTDCDGTPDGDEYPPLTGYQALTGNPLTTGLCSDIRLTLTAQILNQSSTHRQVRHTVMVKNLSGPAASGVQVGFTWAQRVLSASHTVPGSPALCFAAIETPSVTPGTPTPVPSPIRWIAGCSLSGQLAPSGTWSFQFDVTYQVAVGQPLPANTGRVTMTLKHDANDSVPANNVVTWNP